MRQDLDQLVVSSLAPSDSAGGGTTPAGRRRFSRTSLGAGAHAVLALVIALQGGMARAQDAGTPEVVDVELAAVTQPDGGVLHLQGGCWLSDAKCLSTARELAQLRAENAALRQAPAPPQATPAGYLVAVGLGVLGGVALAVAAASAWGR